MLKVIPMLGQKVTIRQVDSKNVEHLTGLLELLIVCAKLPPCPPITDDIVELGKGRMRFDMFLQ